MTDKTAVDFSTMSDLELARFIAERLGYKVVPGSDPEVAAIMQPLFGDWHPFAQWYVISPDGDEANPIQDVFLATTSEEAAWATAFVPDPTDVQEIPFWPQNLGAAWNLVAELDKCLHIDIGYGMGNYTVSLRKKVAVLSIARAKGSDQCNIARAICDAVVVWMMGKEV